MIASRTDQRGIVLTYKYDELGRREEVLIDDTDWYTPPLSGQPDNRPWLRVQSIRYEYEPTGELYRVTSKGVGPAFPSPTTVSTNIYLYDDLRNLEGEFQIRNLAPFFTGIVAYVWETQPATIAGGNSNRLKYLIHPPRQGQTLSQWVEFS